MAIPIGSHSTRNTRTSSTSRKRKSSSSGSYYQAQDRSRAQNHAADLNVAVRRALQYGGGPRPSPSPSGGPPNSYLSSTSGGSSYSDGGYAAAQARAQAEEEARKQKQRAIVEMLFKQTRGRLDTGKSDAMKALPKFLAQANKQFKGINKQSVGAGRDARRQIGLDEGAANRILAQALGGLRGDLQGQGVDIGGLDAAGGVYRAGNAARAAAGENFNSRLNAMMRAAYGDARMGAQQVHQGARSTATNQYQQALAQLQAERAAALMELA
jgi:hypothetical protein